MSKTVTQEEYQQRMFKRYGNKFSLIGKYQKWNVPVDVRCNNCGYIFSKAPNNFFYRNVLCPACNKSSAKCIKGINDLWTTRPDIAKLLKDPKLGYQYKEFSEKRVDFICPDCGNVLSKVIKDISMKGLSCQYCSDGLSYPNKFMSNLLKELNIDFTPEYKIKPYSYRYDFMFIFNGVKYLIEMDGYYGHGCMNTHNKTIDDQINIDRSKDIIAENNGFVIIRIDCKYTNIEFKDRMNYIINSIYNSKLNDIFDFSNIDFNKINKLSLTSIIKLLSTAWNNGIHSYDTLIDMFKLKRDGIRRYLKCGCEIGLINDSYEDLLKTIRLASNKKLQKTKGCQVICNETGELFVSISEAQRKTNAKSICKCLKGEFRYSGRLPDGTRLTWRVT